MTGNKDAALLVRATERVLEHEDDKGSARYSGRLIPDWDIGSVPNGGYSLGTALHCARDVVVRRRGQNHGNLFHSAAAFHSKVSSAKAYVVDVRTLKQGRATTSMEADLLQQSDKHDSLELCLRVQMIFADFGVLRGDATMKPLTIAPGDTYGPRFPLPYADRRQTADLQSWYKPHATPVVRYDHQAMQEAARDGQMTMSKYMYFPREHVRDEDVARHNLAAIGMFCDMTTDTDDMVPQEVKDSLKKQYGQAALWYPTLSLSIEMRQPLPTFALQRVAAFSRIDHLTHGHWSFIVELWSHPDDAELFGLGADDTKPRSIVLAVSQQTALTYSMAVNKGKPRRSSQGKM